VQHLLVNLLRARAGWDLSDLREPFGAGELWAETGGRAAEEEEEKEGGDGGEWCRDAGECGWHACACIREHDRGSLVGLLSFLARRLVGSRRCCYLIRAHM